MPHPDSDRNERSTFCYSDITGSSTSTRPLSQRLRGGSGDRTLATADLWPQKETMPWAEGPGISPQPLEDPQDPPPVTQPSDHRQPHPTSLGKAGRDLRAAIAVGATLAGGVLASLFLWCPAFAILTTIAVMISTWEMVRAVRRTGLHPPMFPLMAGGMVMLGLAWFGGASVLPLGLVMAAVSIAVWRLADGAVGYHRDVTVAVLVATYVPFLASFAVLLARPDDGDLRVLVMLIGVVLSDTAGYVTGVLFGRHPMAPSVSPKKSWEGFAGSVLVTAAGEAWILHQLFMCDLWQGALFGLTIAVAAVFGDLAESLLKRDLGVKDMSNLLPGHGGMMDRMDSILLAAPAAYAVLVFVVPVAS